MAKLERRGKFFVCSACKNRRGEKPRMCSMGPVCGYCVNNYVTVRRAVDEYEVRLAAEKERIVREDEGVGGVTAGPHVVEVGGRFTYAGREYVVTEVHGERTRAITIEAMTVEEYVVAVDRVKKVAEDRAKKVAEDVRKAARIAAAKDKGWTAGPWTESAFAGIEEAKKAAGVEGFDREAAYKKAMAEARELKLQAESERAEWLRARVAKEESDKAWTVWKPVTEPEDILDM